MQIGIKIVEKTENFNNRITIFPLYSVFKVYFDYLHRVNTLNFINESEIMIFSYINRVHYHFECRESISITCIKSIYQKPKTKNQTIVVGYMSRVIYTKFQCICIIHDWCTHYVHSTAHEKCTHKGIFVPFHSMDFKAIVHVQLKIHMRFDFSSSLF